MRYKSGYRRCRCFWSNMCDRNVQYIANSVAGECVRFQVRLHRPDSRAHPWERFRPEVTIVPSVLLPLYGVRSEYSAFQESVSQLSLTKVWFGYCRKCLVHVSVQKMVVKSLPIAKSLEIFVKCHAGHHNQIKPSRVLFFVLP